MLKFNLKNNRKGFTLIELLIVLGIVAIIFSLVIGFLNNFKDKESIDKNINLVAEVLRQAKHDTINSKDSSQYGVHFDSDKIVVFVGPTYSSLNPTNQTYPLDPNIVVYSTSISGGGSDIIFNKLSGSTDNNGDVTLKSLIASTTKTITIYKTGLIE